VTAISVIVPSNRVGGCDVLFAGLANQTLPRDQFELVFVDNLHTKRESLVKDYAREYGLQVTHVKPFDIGTYENHGGSVANGCYQRALNTGIVHSRGRVVVICCDFTYFASDFLKLHLSFHDGDHGGGSVCMFGQIWSVDLVPLIHPNWPNCYGWGAIGHNPALYRDATHVPSYAPWLDDGRRLALIEKWSAQYMKDLRVGTLDPWMWSVFGKPITPSTDISEFRVWQKDKTQYSPGLQHHQLANLKDCSFATEDLLAIGGLNEAMDGCHGHQDSELAGRLEQQRKTRFWYVPMSRVYLFDPHYLTIVRSMERNESANLAIYNEGWTTDFKTPIAQWDLRTKRKELLCL